MKARSTFLSNAVEDKSIFSRKHRIHNAVSRVLTHLVSWDKRSQLKHGEARVHITPGVVGVGYT